MPATIPSSAMPAQISTSVPKLVVLAELAPSANAVAQHSAEMTAAKQPMNEKKLRFLMFVSLLVLPTRMFNFIHRLRAAINGFSLLKAEPELKQLHMHYNT